ncbi:MAG: type II toxin-antitoxin system Phd/YefM family antitoxin [Chloroflexi bacterium]|nr:type II toxin-antitoxin system Phd/YefM family antitoxin [Chloroflexota bacterium]MBU1748528.1 type II toxin-antitoxin system Phd/YefM family antitoxin [Chloroflexota bacterium]
MSELQVSMTELRQSLGRLVNQAAYGDGRIVLVAHGQPKAAIIGVKDLQRLKRLSEDRPALPDQHAQALAAADLLRERIQRWQDAHGITPEDSVITLRQLREEHADEAASLR